MNVVDIGTIVLYLAAMLGIGFYASKKQKNMTDYYVAGRNRDTLSIASLWLSSWIGGASVIGASEKAYDMGITAIWYIGIMGIGLLAFGLTFAKLVKHLGDKLQNITYPDLVEARYGQSTRIASTVSTILAYIAYTASQFAAAGSIISVVTGWSIETSFVVAIVVTTLYTTMGGYLAVTYTDLVQMLLLIIGVAVIGIPVTANYMAGAQLSLASLPASYYDLGAWGWPTIAAFGISMIFSFFTSMDSYTRCYAAKSEKVARNGAMLALVGVLIIAGASTFLGLAARVILPNLESGANSLTTLIITIFPIGMRGIILVGILAAIMSTGDICILTASANITNDIYSRFINKNATDKQLLRLGMLSSFAIGIAGALMAWLMRDIMDILMLAFTINSAGLFLPTVLGFFWKKASVRAATGSMFTALAVVVFWYSAASLGAGGIFAVDPLWPGFFLSAIVFFGISLFGEQSAEEKLKVDGFFRLLK